MNQIYPTIIMRHRKENLKKCSLRGLESNKNFRFFSYPLKQDLPLVTNYVLLTLDAPRLLSRQDRDRGILLIDATWRYAEEMLQRIPRSENLLLRSLPPIFETAYPRRQTHCSDPRHGLASIEALYASYHLLGWDATGLLDQYHWKEAFLEKNKDIFRSLKAR